MEPAPAASGSQGRQNHGEVNNSNSSPPRRAAPAAYAASAPAAPPAAPAAARGAGCAGYALAVKEGSTVGAVGSSRGPKVNLFRHKTNSTPQMVHRSIGVSNTGIPVSVILGSPISGGVAASLQPCFCSKLEPSQLTPKIRLVSYDGGIAMLMAGPLCGAAIRTWNAWRAQDGAGCFGQSEPLGYTSI